MSNHKIEMSIPLKSEEITPSLTESAEYQIQWTETKTLCLSLGRARGKDQTETERFGGVGTHWPPEVVSEQGTPKEKTQRSPELPAEATGDKVERPEDEIICICSGSSCCGNTSQAWRTGTVGIRWHHFIDAQKRMTDK